MHITVRSEELELALDKTAICLCKLCFPSRRYLLGDKVRTDPRLRFILGVYPYLLLVQMSPLGVAGLRENCNSVQRP